MHDFVCRTLTKLNLSWRRIKHDFLHHFHKPRLDLLTWILVEKLAPTYYKKLDHTFAKIGRYRELPSWRKAFKAEWKTVAKTRLSAESDNLYRPRAHLWVCTCPSFVRSRFLICKHLVQSVHPVPPIFFLEVTRNRKAPFWSHPALVPLDTERQLPWPAASGSRMGEGSGEAAVTHEPAQPLTENDDEGSDGEDSANELVDTGAPDLPAMFDEQFLEHIRTIREFCDGLEYQVQFGDRRMLEVLERDGGGFLRLAQNCLNRERRMSSTRGKNPTMWEKGTLNAMFYRTRPNSADATT
jgi:hypothetical protein